MVAVFFRVILGTGIPACDVGATGFEPAASRSQSGRSTKLSYAPDDLPRASATQQNGLDKSSGNDAARRQAIIRWMY